MLLLSIRPRFVDAILAGAKRVELRRRKPRAESGHALIYATSPRMELVASFRVASVVHAPLELLWQSYGDLAGITRGEFDAYFAGLQFGVAISIAEITKFSQPVRLEVIRETWNGFHPPQGFRYLDWADVAKLGISELRGAA